MHQIRLWSMLGIVFLAATFVVACGTPADVVLELTHDQDGDGLDDQEEIKLGTDPAAKDSDNDGYLDGAEVASYTDPTDAEDHPYIGNWPIDACRNSVVQTGNAEGQITPNFNLPNQHEETVKLHDFCGKVVLLVAAAFW